LDALQHHISYRESGLGALSTTRTLRRQWWSIIKSLLVADGPVDGKAITMLLSAACQGMSPDEMLHNTNNHNINGTGSTASGGAATSGTTSSAPSGSRDADEDEDAEELAMAGSLHVAEILEFINELMLAEPDSVYAHLVTAGGAPLLLNILDRFPTHQHIQLAVVHLLAAMLKLGTVPTLKPALRLKVGHYCLLLSLGLFVSDFLMCFIFYFLG
jgi:hypothetical protein